MAHLSEVKGEKRGKRGEKLSKDRVQLSKQEERGVQTDGQTSLTKEDRGDVGPSIPQAPKGGGIRAFESGDDSLVLCFQRPEV